MSPSHRTIVVVDIAGFGDPRRTVRHRIAVRQGLYMLIRESLESVGVPWSSCDVEDRGDGMLLLVPPHIAKGAIADALPRRLVAALDEHNRRHPREEQIRLRMALHAGEVSWDMHGITSPAVNHAFRLLDANALKATLVDSTAALALIVSSSFFEEVVRHTRILDDSFRRVEVMQKETSAAAWVSVAGHPDPPGGPVTSQPRQASSPGEGRSRGSIVNEVSGVVSGAAAQVRVRPGLGSLLPGQEPLERPVPRRLPPSPLSFVGREAELARLDSMLGESDRSVIVSITGMAGVGKTALAVQWADRVRERFPDGTLFVSLRANNSLDPLAPEIALDAFLAELGVQADRVPQEPTAMAALFRALTAGRRMLIVLDDAASTEQVRPLLTGERRCLTLVTSRSQLTGLVTGHGATRLNLDVLAPDEAMDLLRLRLGTERVDAEPEAAGELARLCGHLPLALAVAGARATARPQWSLHDFVERLTDSDARLQAFSRAEVSVRSALDLSYGSLRAVAARAFRLLSLHPGADFSTSEAVSLVGASSASTRLLLHELTESHMIEPIGRDRFQFHSLLREYATERTEVDDPPAERHRAVRRALLWYLHTADSAAQALAPQRTRENLIGKPAAVESLTFETHEEALEWFEAERANLVDAVSRAALTSNDDIAWRLPVALWDFFNLRKHWADWIATSHTGLGSARRTGDRHGEAAVLHTLGNAYYDLRRLEDAIDHYRQALAIRRETGDRQGEGWTLNNLGTAYQQLRNLDTAIEHYQQALAIRREVGDQWGEGWTLNNLGEAHQRLQQFDTAIDYYQQALTNRRTTGDRYGEGFTLDNLGLAYHALRQFDDSILCCQMALTIRREIGDRWGEGWTLNNLGTAFRELGRFEDAIEHYERALNVQREVRDRWGEGWTLDNLGTALQATHRVDEARAHWQAARNVLEDFENVKETDAPPRAHRQARIWCVNDDPVQLGQAAHIAFAMVAPQGVLAGDSPDQPLPRPVELRILLHADNAIAQPVTQVVTLDVDRTSKPILFEVVPTEPGPVDLVFRVYLDRDSQLLQEIRARLPVAVPQAAGQ